MTNSWGRRLTRPLSALVALVLFAGMLVFGFALTATATTTASTGDVSGASLTWGIKDSWRNYVSGFGGSVALANGASASPAPYGWGGSTGGSYDEATGAADVSFGGAITFTVPAHHISITLSHPELTLTDAATGNLSFDYTDSAGAGGTAVFATLDLTTGTNSVNDGVASFSGVAAAAGPGSASVFGGFYTVGAALDTVSFSLPFEAAPPAPVVVTTATTLTATPAAATEGDTITLSASVTPAVAGSIRLVDGTDALPSPVAVDAAGSASATVVATTGTHSYTAEFTPTETSAYAASTSGARVVTVTDAPVVVTPVATVTTLAVTPAAPVLLGSATTLTATVVLAPATPVSTGTPASTGTPVTPPAPAGTAAMPQGTVEFFDVKAVTAGTAIPVSLGTAPVTGGVATLPLTPLTPLTAGGHTFTAAFAPAAGSAFIASTVTSTANYGVVDTTVKSVQAPGSDAKTLAGISANWDYSAYSSAWVKTATGNVAVNGQTFALTGGTATYDSGAAVIDFTGSIRVLAYPGIADAWVQLTDPSLAVDASGAGAWSATVTTSAAPDARGTRLVVATLTGAVLPTFGTTGSTSYSLDFAGTTAPGTWSVSAGVAYTNAWSNAFVLQVPTSIRAFYYSSGTSAAQATKPPSPLAVQWTAAVPPTETVGTAGSLVWGFKDSWRTYLTMFGATVTAAGGATVGADGLFSFSQAPAGSAGSAGMAATTGPAAEYDPATGVGTLKYQGSVDFANASHGFDIALQNPWVTFAADGTVVLSAETSTSDTVGLSSLARIDVATLADSSSTTDANGRLVFSNLSGIFSSVLQPGGWSQYQSVATDPVSFSYGLNAPVVVVPPVVTPPLTVPTAPTPLQPVLTGDGTVVAAPVQPVCVAQVVSGATLTWGVKQSFVSYITGPIAKGAIATSGVSAGDGFTWSGGTGTFNASDSRGLVSFGGSVHFTGHAGALDLAIANPRVQILSASSAVLVADVASKALQGSGVNGTVSLASIDLSSASAQVAGGRARWVDAPTTLTASGATAFGGFYTAGQALDSLTISAPLGASTNCDGYSAAAGSAGAAGSLASTGADVTPLWGGLALLLAGVGILSLRRRRRTTGV